MGEIADDEIEQGQDAWFAHLHGTCEDNCEYCEKARPPVKEQP